MTTSEAIRQITEYVQRESARVPFGDLSVSVSLHKGDMRKMTFATTVKSVPSNPDNGRYHDDRSK